MRSDLLMLVLCISVMGCGSGGSGSGDAGAANGGNIGGGGVPATNGPAGTGGTTGLGGTPGAAGPKYNGPAFVEVAPASGHVCALSMDGKVYCWGENADGQLGTGDKNPRLNPVAVSGISTAKHVAAGNGEMGSGTTCAILNDDTLKCWGLNGKGQLGTGDTASVSTPTAVLDSTMKPLGHVAQVSVAGNSEHVCALKDDHTVWCWGNNLRAQTGQDPTANETVKYATQVLGLTNVSQISAGSGNTCATKTDGTAWCWGFNDGARSGADAGVTCGPEPFPCVKLPQQIGSGSNYRMVAAGSTSCALTTDGTVECWGTANVTSGFPGDDGSEHIVPVKVAGLANVSSIGMEIGAFEAAACALKSDNSLWCWGDNTYGELGMDTHLASSVAAIAITGLPAVSGFGVQITNCAISKTDGSLWCWGSNSGRQLAAANGGDTVDSTIPSPAQIQF